MAKSFGDPDKKDAGKRPTPTIEGTAKEIAVEPEVEATPEMNPAQDDELEVDTQPEQAASDEAPEGSKRIEFGPPPRERAPRLKRFASYLGAGLLGGAVGAAGAGLAWNGLQPGGPGGAPGLAALEQRLAKLEAAPPPASSSDGAEAVAAIEGRIKALEGRAAESAPELSSLAERITELETAMKTLADTAQEGGSVADAAALAERIAEAEKRLQAKIDAALAEADLESAAAVQALKTEIGELRAKLGALAEAELGTGAAADLAPELDSIADRLAKLEAALPGLEAAIGKEGAEAKSAALAIAFANLSAAVDAGRPYATELDTLKTLSPSAGDLGVLPAHAATGIPTLPELVRAFAPARDAALAAETPPPPADASLLDRLLASLNGLVKIRRVDAAAPGDGTSAALARAEAQLGKGNLEGAIKEVEALDGAARAALSAWLEQARARAGVASSLKRLEGLLLVGLGGGEQAPAETEN
jgi:hypothetical protein